MKKIKDILIICIISTMFYGCAKELDENWKAEFKSNYPTNNIYLKTETGDKVFLNDEYFEKLDAKDVYVYFEPAGVETKDISTDKVNKASGSGYIVLKGQTIPLGTWEYSELKDIAIMLNGEKCQWVELRPETSKQDFDISLYLGFCNYTKEGTTALKDPNDMIELVKLSFKDKTNTFDLAELLFYNTAVDHVKDKYLVK